MNRYHLPALFSLFLVVAPLGHAQVTNALPGRALVKLVPDYLRPRVYALNRSSGSTPGTLLALDATNGAIINEISLNLNPTDMAVTPPGDALYVIHAGSRTISKVDLDSFAVASEKSITTPNTYSLSNPLYVVAGQSGRIYYTDGAWGPEIYYFNYDAGTNLLVLDTGGNQSIGAGGMLMNRSGNTIYIWQQYGWSAGFGGSSIASLAVGPNSLTTSLTGPSQNRDPLDTPIFLDASETRVFNKVQMVAATNVSVLLSQFTENIYAISFDGSLAFGSTKVFNAQNGIALTNFTWSATVQALSGDQKKLFRFNASTASLVVYDMSAIAPVSGPTITPTPADGAVVGVPPTNLLWSVSPIALAYDVYFGTNQAQVSAATPVSPQYLGRVSTPGTALPQPLSPGSTYYWRVDIAGFSTTNIGPTWSFTVSTLAVIPAQINIGAVAGYNPASVTLSFTSSVPIAWSGAVSGANWLAISPINGTSPSVVTATFNTTGLAAGVYTNRIDISLGTLKVQVPVTLDIKPLNIVKMAADYQRPYIYALQAPAASGQNGQLLFINTTTSNIDKTLPIGINPVDLTVHYGEGRLYVASWTENATYVVDLTTQTLLPPLHLGTDIYKINAGKPGRIVTEGEDQWIAVNIVDTSNGNVVGSMPYPEREGDGEMDPTGTFYYHCDNNISDAYIHKEQIINDIATEVAGSLQHPYGTRNLVLSPDGTTLFWNSYVFDANLNQLGGLGEEIYTTTAHGDLALGGTHVFNARNGQIIYTWPFSTSVLAVSGDEQRVFLFNTTTKALTVIPMSSIASVPAPGLNPTPADGAVVNLPLNQVSWTASPFALSYRLFLGTNQAAVATADTNSALYLGQTFNTAFALTNVLTAGKIYYWRVDLVGFSTTTTGPVWAFTASGISAAPQNLSVKGVTGLPILPQSISLTAPAPTAWTLSVQQPSWLSVTPSSGTTPSSVTLNFNTTNLPAGYYTNQLTLIANGIALQLPVLVQLFNLSASKMAADRNRNYIYVLHPGSGSFADAFLLFLNTDTGVVEKVIPIGTDPTDLTVHPLEDRLYVSNWQQNQTRVVDLVSRTELPPLALGTDIYKINAGRAGRIITEGEDQWIGVNLVDTATGLIVGGFPYPEREGDGEADPTGTVYYHCDNNISDAHIHKFVATNDSPVEVAGSNQHPYGTRNLVLSPDGTKLFWNGYLFDTNLNELGPLGGEIYSCSTNGSVAFTSSQAFDTATRQVIFNLPFSSTVSAVDRNDQRFWYFNSTSDRIESVALSTVRSPSITQQPTANTSVAAGGSVYLSVTAMGLGPLSYQWIMGGTNLPGATNYFLSMAGIQSAQQGDYQVVVSNLFNSVTSSVAHITVLVPPTIVAQPQGTNVFAGQSFNLLVAATGSAPLSYHWTFENSTIPGATGATLTIPNSQAANEGVYRALVSNPVGVITSAVAFVRVMPSAPMLSGPSSLVVSASSNATFNVTAIGTQPMSYQWWFNGAPIAGATSSQYSIYNVQTTNAGNYQVLVTNVAGPASSAATLTVLPFAPYFVTQPVGATLPAGTNLTLTGFARGSEPISYRWLRNGTNFPGGVLTSLTLSNLSLNDSAAYSLAASNIAGMSSSLVAIVTVTAAPPLFVQQPVSLSVLAGSTNTLNTLATGSAPLFYQWYFQNNPLLNQTNRQLTLSPTTLASAGQYYAVASNLFATATSLVATVTVTTAPPVFVQQPASLSALVGSSTTLNSQAAGATPLLYQWYFQNGPLLNQTNRQLTLNPVSFASAGAYFVLASNIFGVSTSAVVEVTVNQAPTLLQSLTNQVVNAGANVTLAIDATGTAPLTYSWQLNGTPIPGSNDTLLLRNIQSAQSGYYRVTITSPYGNVSSTGRVSVFGPASFVIAWGDNSGGQTNVPVILNDAVAVAGGDYHSLGLRRSGTLLAWGYNGDGQTNSPASQLRFVSIAAGAGHNLAITENGSVVAWGRNDYGQANVPASATSVLAVAAGESHSLALLSSGTVVAWGDNSLGQTSVPQGVNGVTAIAAGRNHCLALRTNGTVVAWGFNTYGQASPPETLSNAIAIASGYLHSAALLSNGAVLGWGDNTFGQTNVPPGLTNVIAIAAGDFHTLALRADGSIVGWGDNSLGQTSVPPSASNVIAVASGNYHALALIPPILRLVHSAGGLVITWNVPGVLQWAPTPEGPYSDIPGLGRSYTNSDLSLPAKFFRLHR